MACPNCGCKETYQYAGGDDFENNDEGAMRCAACGSIFWIEDESPEEFDDEEVPVK